MLGSQRLAFLVGLAERVSHADVTRVKSEMVSSVSVRDVRYATCVASGILFIVSAYKETNK